MVACCERQNEEPAPEQNSPMGVEASAQVDVALELVRGTHRARPYSLIMPLSPGTTLGPYAVTAKIGEGGMGEVYKARDTRLDRTVAIKVLPEHVANDPDLKQRFEREAKTISSLNHGWVIFVQDDDEEDDLDDAEDDGGEDETEEEDDDDDYRPGWSPGWSD